jgi:hypothetical protein
MKYRMCCRASFSETEIGLLTDFSVLTQGGVVYYSFRCRL